jgi:hypothetical protein
MARVTLDDFADKEVARVYLAAELAEAKRVEEILSANGINYVVEVERYVRRVFLPPSTPARHFMYFRVKRISASAPCLRPD